MSPEILIGVVANVWESVIGILAGASESFALFLAFAIKPEFAGGYCVLIVIFFSFSWLSLHRRTRRIHKTIRRLHQELNGIQRKDGFVKEFERYNKQAEEAFGLPWTEFVETLVLPEPASGDPIRNTGEVSWYLNDTSIIAPKIPFGFYRSVPNLLTGLGILGTFLGLAGGVGSASSGLSSGAPGEITASLQQLLDGAALAFLTSIFGIAGSILFVLIERSTSRRLHRALDSWVEAIQSRLERVTSESVALKQLEQGRQTAEQLRRFNTDLIFALEQALEEKVAGRLSPQLDRLVEAVERLREDRSTDAGSMIDRTLGQLTDAIQERAGPQFEEMAAVVANLSRTLKDSTESLDRSTHRSEQILTDMTRFVDQFNTLCGTIEATHRQIAEIVEPVGHAARDIRTSTDKAADALDRTSGIIDRVEVAVNTLGQHQQAVADAWTRYQDRFEGIDGSLARVFRQIDEGLSGYCEQVKEFANELDRTTSKTIQDLAGATAELSGSIEDLIPRLPRPSR